MSTYASSSRVRLSSVHSTSPIATRVGCGSRSFSTRRLRSTSHRWENCRCSVRKTSRPATLHPIAAATASGVRFSARSVNSRVYCVSVCSNVWLSRAALLASAAARAPSKSDMPARGSFRVAATRSSAVIAAAGGFGLRPGLARWIS